MTAPARGRIAVLDTLRAAAALAVLWNHLTNGLLEYPPLRLLRSAGEEAWVGVPVFFVISGFVIPHALHAARFQLRDYGRFVLKRMIRIDLPCYASIAIILALGVTLGPLRFETDPRHVTWLQVVLHLGYLNYLCGYEFLNGALWSLAIELQYYLVVALAFPLLADRRPAVRLYVFVLLGILGVVAPDRQLLFHYGGLFLLGIHTFHLLDGFIDRRVYLLGLLPLAALTLLQSDALSAGAGLLTALVIAFVRRPTAALGLFGKLSYSLYLIHVPVGLRVLRWAGHPGDGPARQLGVLALAAAAATGSAWLLWRLVELPAQRWAGRISYGAGDERCENSARRTSGLRNL